MSVTIKNKLAIKGKLSLGSSPGGTPVNRTDDTYWQNWAPGDTVYSWTGTEWDPAEDFIQNVSGITPITAGGNTGWQVGYDATSVEMTVKSDPLGSGPSIGNNIVMDFYNSNGDIAGSVTFSFDSFGQTKVFTVNLSLGGFDIAEIRVDSLFYGYGPLISALVFDDA